DEIKAKVEPLQKILDTQTPELDGVQAKWLAEVRSQLGELGPNWTVLAPEQFRAAAGRVTLEELDDNSLLSAAPTPETNTYEIIATTSLTNISAIRLEALVDERLPNKGSGRSEDGDFVLTDFALEAEPIPSTTQPTMTNPPPRLGNWFSLGPFSAANIQ